MQPIYGLDTCIKYGRSNRKYILMFDCTGQVENYFQYKGHLKQLHKDHLRIAAGSQTKEEVLESLRKAVVASMQKGDTLVLSLDKLNLDLSDV